MCGMLDFAIPFFILGMCVGCEEIWLLEGYLLGVKNVRTIALLSKSTIIMLSLTSVILTASHFLKTQRADMFVAIKSCFSGIFASFAKIVAKHWLEVLMVNDFSWRSKR